MSLIQSLKQLYTAYLSKPVGDRPIFQAIRRQPPRRIVQLGVGDGERTERVLAFVTQLVDGKVQFTGQDLFEGRSDNSGMKLKEAHQRFASGQVSSRLAPGDVRSVLMRMANSLTETDLLLISNDHEPENLEAAWYYVPRMLHERSIVLVQDADASFTTMDLESVNSLASAACPNSRAA